MANPSIADVQAAVARKTGGSVSVAYHQVRSAVRSGRIPAIWPSNGINGIRFRPETVDQAADAMIALVGGGAA